MLHTVLSLRHSPPISHLPDEILEEIFFIISCFYRNRLRNTSQRFPSWFHFSQVCRSWRTVSLSSSRLWTWLHICRHEDLCMAYELLYRSRGRDIDVCIEDDGNWVGRYQDSVAIGAADMLVPHLSRLRNLAVTELDADNLQLVLDVLSLGAPRLHRLHLSSSGAACRIIRAERIHIPSLRYLSIACNIPTTSLLYSNLTSLHLRWSPRLEDHYTLSMKDICLMFNRCPNLQDLDLNFEAIFQGLPGGEDISLFNTIKLAHLDHLALRLYAISVLSMLSFPPTTEIILQAPPLFAPSQSQYRTLRQFTSKMVRVNLSIRRNNRFAHATLRADGLSQRKDQYYLRWLWQPGSALQSSERRFNIIDFPSAEQLILDWEGTQTPPVIMSQLLCRLPRVKTVEMFLLPEGGGSCGDASPRDKDAWAEQYDEAIELMVDLREASSADVSRSGKPLCPALTKIKISGPFHAVMSLLDPADFVVNEVVLCLRPRVRSRTMRIKCSKAKVDSNVEFLRTRLQKLGLNIDALDIIDL